MADRKQFLSQLDTDDELSTLLLDAQKNQVSEDQLREQRVSFAFGNSPDSKFITKDSVLKASQTIRIAS